VESGRSLCAVARAAAARYAAAMSVPLSLKTRLSTPLFVQTRSWYCDLFHLEVLEEWDEPADRGCILGLPAAADAFLEIYQCDGPPSFAGLSLQFRVDDVDAFVVPDEDRFRHSGPVDRPWGSKYLFFSDPNGVSVVVFSGTSL
jgi:catechol 2,3-dioxygenase-like lactoylglutathione lyase family enzyme